MTTDIYAPPEANLDGPKDTDSGPQFYVVGKTKFTVLYLMTLSYYGVYWHYKNWALYKESQNASMVPVLRTIFQVFFTHSLFGLIDDALKTKDREFSWSPKLYATGYVILLVGGSVGDSLADSLGWYETMNVGVLMTYTIGVTLGFVIIQWLILGKAQSAANIASGDPQGESNQQFTAANWLWIVLGALMLLFAIVGIAAIFVPGMLPEVQG